MISPRFKRSGNGLCLKEPHNKFNSFWRKTRTVLVSLGYSTLLHHEICIMLGTDTQDIDLFPCKQGSQSLYKEGRSAIWSLVHSDKIKKNTCKVLGLCVDNPWPQRQVRVILKMKFFKGTTRAYYVISDDYYQWEWYSKKCPGGPIKIIVQNDQNELDVDVPHHYNIFS